MHACACTCVRVSMAVYGLQYNIALLPGCYREGVERLVHTACIGASITLGLGVVQRQYTNIIKREKIETV